MSSRSLAAVLAGCLIAAAPAAAQVPAKSEPARAFGEVAPGTRSLMVTFTDVPTATAAHRRLRGLGTVRPLAPEAGVWRLVPARAGGAREAALARPSVRSVEWPLVRRAALRATPATPLPPIPLAPLTDPWSVEQWGLQHNGWSPDLVGRTPRPIIAVLDGGLDTSHEEWRGAAGAIVAPRSVIPGRNPLNVRDWGESGHGTHVAGIAAAPANGLGVVGVAPAGTDARLMPIQVADRIGQFRDEDIIAGIRWAVQNGAKVINISAGGTGDTRAFQRTVLWASRRGALIVAAVGNEGDAENELLYPAAYRRVLGVGAQCGPERTLDCSRPFGVASFSQRNGSVDLIAPGVDILSTVPVRVREDGEVAEGYVFRDGTSMAAPYVAGVAALLQAANGNTLSPFQVARHLQATADDQGPRGRDDRTGWGAVNVRRALTTPVPPDDVGEPNDDITYLRNATDLSGGTRLLVEADIDRFDDPDDVYAVRVRAGRRLRVEVTNARGLLNVYIWGAGTRTVATTPVNTARNLLAFAGKPRRKQVAVIRAKRTGRVYVNVYARRGTTPYTMRIRQLR